MAEPKPRKQRWLLQKQTEIMQIVEVEADTYAEAIAKAKAVAEWADESTNVKVNGNIILN